MRNTFSRFIVTPPFGTFFATAKQDEPINIAMDKITSIANINDKIREEYKRVFSKQIY